MKHKGKILFLKINPGRVITAWQLTQTWNSDSFCGGKNWYSVRSRSAIHWVNAGRDCASVPVCGAGKSRTRVCSREEGWIAFYGKLAGQVQCVHLRSAEPVARRRDAIEGHRTFPLAAVSLDNTVPITLRWMLHKLAGDMWGNANGIRTFVQDAPHSRSLR